LQEGRAPRLPQPVVGISLTRHINRSTATLDPAQGAISLERLIRAMNPKPGAHGIFFLPSGKSISLKIFSATVASEIVDKSSKSLFLSQDQKLLLACNQGALWLHEVQPEGRARMSAAAFVAGYFRTLF
jgi:methionyl-tRNA formyltransferase